MLEAVKDKRYFVAMSQEHWLHYTQGHFAGKPKGGVIVDVRENGPGDLKSRENSQVSLAV
jgi:hypothetical protein